MPDTYLWGVPDERFYFALIIFLISLTIFIILSFISLIIQCKRERKYHSHRREVHKPKSDFQSIFKLSHSSDDKGKDRSFYPLGTSSQNNLLNNSKQLKFSRWHLYPDSEVPVGWDWVLPPFSGILMTLGFFVVAFILEIPDEPVPWRTLTHIAIQLLLLLFAIWMIFRITEVLVPSEHYFFRRQHNQEAHQHGHKNQGVTGKTLIPVLMKYVRLLILIVFCCIIAQSLGFPIASILGGLGIVGIAVAFAASAILENIFGACLIVLEKPFNIGDWIMINGNEGVVERIGFRTTHIRQFDKRLTIVPNLAFIKNEVHNFQESKPVRLKFPIIIPSTTDPDKVEKFLRKGRKFLAKNPMVNPEPKLYITGINLNAFELEAYVWMAEPWNPKDDVDHDWEWYRRSLFLKEQIMLGLFRIARQMSIEVAIPQTKVTIHDQGKTPSLKTSIKPEPKVNLMDKDE